MSLFKGLAINKHKHTWRFKMQKYSLDYEYLQPKPKTFKLEDVKDRLEKVAFDVVRFVDDDTAGLWQINQTDDGEYIVAQYEDHIETEKQSSWNAVLDKQGSNVNIFYGNSPVTKISVASLGLENNDAKYIERALTSSLGNKEFLRKFLSELPQAKRDHLINTNVELRAAL